MWSGRLQSVFTGSSLTLSQMVTLTCKSFIDCNEDTLIDLFTRSGAAWQDLLAMLPSQQPEAVCAVETAALGQKAPVPAALEMVERSRSKKDLHSQHRTLGRDRTVPRQTLKKSLHSKSMQSKQSRVWLLTAMHIHSLP